FPLETGPAFRLICRWTRLPVAPETGSEHLPHHDQRIALRIVRHPRSDLHLYLYELPLDPGVLMR
ncbi:MAG: hypothetical protein OXK77_05150, partial [Gemmatimonadota bacterium]|nr:hypothetical protein [Gemmatimonadota bacterium]MDE2865689.1 hypothetical protein [Gemmatimonadota bacterium]